LLFLELKQTTKEQELLSIGKVYWFVVRKYCCLLYGIEEM